MHLLVLSSFRPLKYLLVGLFFASTLFSGSAVAAQTAGDLKIEAEGLSVTATFLRPTPCTPYVIDWGDDATDAYEAGDGLCTQVISETTLRHDYWEAGRYTVTLTMEGKTYSERVSVPDGELEFDSDDIASVTTQWIDPTEELADQAGYVYTITLKNGTQVLVETPEFSLAEGQKDLFREAGFSGDVDDLISTSEAISDPATEVPEPQLDPADERLAIYRQLVSVLTVLIARMEDLLELRAQ